VHKKENEGYTSPEILKYGKQDKDNSIIMLKSYKEDKRYKSFTKDFEEDSENPQGKARTRL